MLRCRRVAARPCLIALMILVSCGASASPFSRPDQVGQRLMENGKAAEAAARFTSPEHRAMALHESGDQAGAMEHWAAIGNARSEYNLGTTLTRAGDYQRAIEAFDRSAALPDTPAGNAHNRDIATQLLEMAQAEQDASGEGDQGDQQAQSGSESGEAGEAAPAGQAQDDDSNTPSEAAPAQPERESDAEPEPASEPAREGDQAAEQLLNRVPDDPAGLLRARIMREHQRRHQGAGDTATPW